MGRFWGLGGRGVLFDVFVLLFGFFWEERGGGGECKICRLEMGRDEFSRDEKGERMNTEGYCTNKTLPTITNTIQNPIFFSLSLSSNHQSSKDKKKPHLEKHKSSHHPTPPKKSLSNAQRARQRSIPRLLLMEDVDMDMRPRVNRLVLGKKR